MLDNVFLRDIIEHPDDDAPRLIYADWLDDRGDADRAELIRIQCALARLDLKALCGTDLARREQDLLGRHLSAWWGELPEWARQESALGPAHAFSRGFIHNITAAAPAFLAGAEELFGRFPVVSAHLTGAGACLPHLLACAHLARITSLTLTVGPIGVGGTRALAACPHLARLTALDLSQNGVGDDGARALAESPVLSRLTELHLTGNGIGDSGARELADSPHFANLTVLSLGNNRIGDAGALALATSAQLRRLQFLDLTSNPISRPVASALRLRYGGAVLLPP